jgi:hypothetical protein
MKCKALWQSLCKEHELFSVYLLSQNLTSAEGTWRIPTAFMSHPLPQHFSIMSHKGVGRTGEEHIQTNIYIYMPGVKDLPTLTLACV